MLNGISALNLLDTVTDLISNNADEINENDEMNQGVNHTHDKFVNSHYLVNMSNYAWENIRSLPLKNCSAFYTALLSLSIQTNAPPEINHLSNTNSVPNIKTLRNISKETLLANKAIDLR